MNHAHPASARWLAPARLAWLGLVSLLLALYAYDISLGVLIPDLSASNVAWRMLMPLGFVAIGGVIFWRKSNDWMGLLTSFCLVSLGPFILTGVSDDLLLHPGWQVAGSFLQGIVMGSFTLLVFVFPDGQFVPAWARPIGLAPIAFPILAALFALVGWPETVIVTIFLAWVLLGLALQVYRYRRVSGPVERQQSKWVLAGLLSPVLLISFYFAVIGSTSTDAQAQTVLQPLMIVETVLALVLPLTIAFSILRYRLWDIDLIFNRALVYGTLTLLLALGYLGAVVILQSVFQAVAGQARSELVTVLSTLLIAAIAAPLRRRLQSAIDRRFYRRRYDAARALAGFSATLRDDVDLDQLSGRLMQVVEDTMQPVETTLWINPRQM